MNDRRFELIHGVDASFEELERLRRWVRDENGVLFWRILSAKSDFHHVHASEPALAFRRSPATGQEHLVPLATLDAMAREQHAQENACDQILAFADIIESAYQSAREKLGLDKE